MTCFWDAILGKLPRDTITKYLGDADSTTTFIRLLKEYATRTNINDVMWNGTLIPPRKITECLAWIRDYDIGAISNGHDTSICDPFLVLICHLFMYDIDHDYRGTTMRYHNMNNRSGIKLN